MLGLVKIIKHYTMEKKSAQIGDIIDVVFSNGQCFTSAQVVDLPNDSNEYTWVLFCPSINSVIQVKNFEYIKKTIDK